MLEPIPRRKLANLATKISQKKYKKDGELNAGDSQKNEIDYKPFVSIVVPAYNEELIIEGNLTFLCDYMQKLEKEYDWEIVIVNDGSHDRTGELAEKFAEHQENIYVIHHTFNCGLGQALRTGFDHSQGDYIITIDIDLSYAPKYIEALLEKIRETGAKMVLTSPYMKGGMVSNVPWLRKSLSVWANRFLSFSVKRNLATLTGMVRAYDAEFIKVLNLKSLGMEINTEIIHKATLLDARIEEIPAHLSWQPIKTKKARKTRRKSSMKIFRYTWIIFFFGFLLRPVMFFIIPSLIFFLMALYTNIWVLIHCWESYQALGQFERFPDPSDAVANAFANYPHTFIIGGMTLMLAIQLFGLGVMSLQSKRYFEEIFYLGTSIYKSTRKDKETKD